MLKTKFTTRFELENMKVNQKIFWFLFIVGSAFAQGLEESIKSYLKPGDRVVWLSPLGGADEFLNIENFKTSEAPNGHCFGINYMQLALWSSIEFKAGIPEKEDIIKQKLIEAARTGKRQIIDGFSSLAQFLKKMRERGSSSPLRAAITEIQNSYQIQLDEDQVQVKWSVSPQKRSGHPHIHKMKPTAQQISELQNKIDQHVPVPLIVLPVLKREKESMTVKDVGHAVTVVGYIQNEKEIAPSRFLVIDSNAPGKVKVLELHKEGWQYELLSNEARPPSQTIPVAIAASPVTLEQSQNLKSKFQKKELHSSSPVNFVQSFVNKIVPSHPCD